jgi:hypothetical protein
MVRTTQPESGSWRQQVEKRYGSKLPDETWEWLVGKQYIEELDEGMGVTVDYVVDQIRLINRAAPAAHARSRRRVVASDPESASVFTGLNNRLEALAEVIAWRAARSSAVSVYRRRWLRDKLIDADEVAAWIDRTYHDHLPKNWPTDRGPAQATNFPGRFALWPHAHRVLEWIDTAASTSKIWCVPTRGPLGELAGLVEKLADRWDWNKALATTFVLTGDTPARPGVRAVSFRKRSGSDDTYGSYDLMSVRCSIDIEVTPEELAAWWRGVRAALGVSGRRPMGDKSVALAKFALSRTDDSKTFRQDMEDWNAEAPEEWHFDDYRNFRTAAKTAIEALNHPAAGSNFPIGH